MLVIGLTGGVATGKSMVSERLRKLGAEIVDADQLAREVVEPGEPALLEIARRFGEGVLTQDGRLDRARLAAIIFHDEVSRRALEGIVHPPIRRRMRERLDALRADGKTCIAVADIPLLYESKGSLDFVDKVVVVYATVPQQVARLMERNGLSESEAMARVRAQIPTEQKVKWADYVIDNSGATEATLKQIDELWEEWRTDAGCTDRP